MTLSLERKPETLEAASLLKQELLRRLRPPGIHAASAFTFREAVRDGLIGPSSNIVGIGYGVRTVSSEISSDEGAVIVYVRKKRLKRELSLRELVPPSISGHPTDVVEVGEITAGAATASPSRRRSARDTLNPMVCGVSGAHHNVSLGTIGCVVRVAGSEEDHILSCNHVFADSNRGGIGDPILQAALGDGGTRPVAALAAYEPLRFAAGGTNRIDAAIASVHKKQTIFPTIRKIGRVGAPIAAAPLMAVKKHGRTSFFTTGRIRDISADITVGYGISGTALFEDQLTIDGDLGNISATNPQGNFGQGGDSGALVTDAEGQAVGLLFAVASDSRLAYSNPIGVVLKRFAATIV